MNDKTLGDQKVSKGMVSFILVLLAFMFLLPLLPGLFPDFWLINLLFGNNRFAFFWLLLLVVVYIVETRAKRMRENRLGSKPRNSNN